MELRPPFSLLPRWQRVLCARRPRPMCVIADIREVVQVVVRSVFAAPQPSALLALSRIVCEQRWTGYIWPVSRCARTKHVAGAETVGESDTETEVYSPGARLAISPRPAQRFSLIEYQSAAASAFTRHLRDIYRPRIPRSTKFRPLSLIFINFVVYRLFAFHCINAAEAFP